MAEVTELQPSDTEEEEIDEEAFTRSLPRPSAPSVVSAHQCLCSVDNDRGDCFLPVFSPDVRFCGDALPEDESDSSSTFTEVRTTLALDPIERSYTRQAGGHDGGSGSVNGHGLRQGDPFSVSVVPGGFEVLNGAEDMGSDYLELGPGSVLGFGGEMTEEDEEGGVKVNLEDEETLDLGGDDFFLGVRSTFSLDNGETSRSHEGEGLRIVGFGTDSDSDDGEISCSMSSDNDVVDGPDRMFDDVGLPLCWDCLQIEGEGRDRDAYEDFDWEEVDGRTNDREVASTPIIDDDSSISPDEEDTNIEIDDVEERGVHNVEWEVLIAMNNLDRNAQVEHGDSEYYLGEELSDDVYASEYEVLFDQFADHENFIKAGHPAAEFVIEHLPSVFLTQLDLANNNNLCAVCKDEISLKDKAKQLPCSHHYHSGCILPWLRIRNTCPVCRHELPTDNPSYENWRGWRATNDAIVQDS